MRSALIYTPDFRNVVCNTPLGCKARTRDGLCGMKGGRCGYQERRIVVRVAESEHDEHDA